MVPNRQTRQFPIMVFSIDNKIGNKYAKSPFYKGVKLWDQLSKEEQGTDNMYDFKPRMKQKHNTYIRNYYVQFLYSLKLRYIVL